MNYNVVAKRVLQYVGGEQNVESVIHCATRLRFKLKQKDLIDIDKIKGDPDLIGFVEAQGQTQIIVGTEVGNLYDELEKLINKNTAKDSIDSMENSNTKQTFFDRILGTISSIFTPYIPVLASAGIFKGIVALLSNFSILSTKSDTYAMFTGIGNSLIYFFPILLAFTAAKQFKANPYIGATIGAALLEPNIFKITTTGRTMDLFGIHLVAQNFSSTVIPILISMWVFAQLQHWLEKVLPKSTQLILVPFLSCLVIVPLTLMVFGPIGFALANGVVVVYKFLLSTNMILFQAIFGAFFIFIIMFGVHWVLLPIQLQVLASQGKEYSLASGGMGGYALLGVCLAVMIFAKKKADKEMAGSAFFINALSGVTEPGIYGVMIKNKKYIVSVILGGFSGGLVHGITGTYITSFAFAGILGSPAFLSSPKAATYFLGVAVAIIVGFVSTMILTGRELREIDKS